MSRTLSIREVPGAEWDTVVSAMPCATVYHRDGWLGALEEAEALTIRRVVCEERNIPVAAWAVGLMRKGPLRVAGSPLPGWNTAYLGPLFAPGSASADKLDAIRRMTKHLGSPSFFATRLTDTQLDLSSAGFRKTRDFETYEIDLELSEQDLWTAMKGTCRTRIRKGEKNGLEVREETGDSYLDDFWTMASDVFAKSNQRPPYSRALLDSLEDRLRPRGELLVTSAYLGDERIATLIIPHDSSTGMYFAGGTRADRLGLAPNNLLHWKTMLACKERGLRRYDFISNRGNPGRFKKTFSPIERVSCTHWERTSNPLIRMMRDRYERRARAKRELLASDEA